MKALIIIISATVFFAQSLAGQFTEDVRNFAGGPVMYTPSNPMSRSVQNPTKCTGDTSYYPNYNTTAYRSVSVRKGSALGQYFGANQSITVSGFRFYGYALTTSPPKNYTIRLICNLYKAGIDSLPSGSPLASDTVTLDTVMGANILLNRITRNAVFKNPVTLNYDYIITVESDSANVNAGIVTNSWLANPPDGRKKNLGCGSVSGKWYRCLQLNIGGVNFDSDMQLYPFVKYNLGADFSVVNNCYNANDTVKFNNLFENNVSSLPYYNFYLNYNLSYYCQRWSYDGSAGQSFIVDGFYKPGVKKNFNVRLITAVYSYASGQCYDTVNKMVYFKPVKPSLKSSAFGCIGDTVKLNIAGDAGADFNWYYSPSDKTPFNTGTSLEIQGVTKSDTFYVQSINGDCKSPFLEIDFTVSEHPKDPILFHDSICQGAVANLRATADKGQIEWFVQSSGGTAFQIGNELQTDKLFKDTAFFVHVNNKGCYNPSGRLAVNAYVNNSFAPDKPIVITDTFMCLKPSTSITLSASQTGSDTLRWFDESTGGIPLGMGGKYVYTPVGREDDAIYVETWNGVCGSGRSPINIHVYDYPTIFGLRGDTICKGDSAQPFLSVPWGNAHWYLNKGDIVPIASGKTPIIGGLNSNQKLYISTEEYGCVSPSRDSVQILVNVPPVPSSIVADAVCSKSAGFMEVKVPYGNVNWYYELADPTPFLQTQKVDAGVLLSNITYYYETEFKGCKTAKQALTIAVKPRPTAGFTWVLQWQNRLICTPITVAGLTLAWEWGDGTKTTGAPYLHQYTTKGNYTVRMVATSNANGCKDTADIPVIIDHTGINNLTLNEHMLYPIPVKAGEILHFENLTGIVPARILNVNGSEVCKLEVSNGQSQIPNNLMSGLYIVQILGSKGTENHQLVVSN